MTYPTYYKKFKCIASLCPDSCCKDWDVVVDSETEASYNSINTDFGDKLRSLMLTDSDGDRIFESQSGRCPFWNSDMLCDIYINLGEEHLCETCKSFPRITQDYGAFAEKLLSFACPEAARLMLAEDNAYTDFKSDYELVDTDYDADTMRFILKAREKTAQILNASAYSFAENLKDCLAFNSQVQDALNGNEPAPLGEIPQKTDCGFIFDLHLRLEIMDNHFAAELAEVAKNRAELKIPESLDDSFKKLALYYIYRYYLTAIDSGDVLGTIRRIACAYIIIGKWAAFCDRDIQQIMQRYSKEVEHSYENNEELDFEFAANPNFSVENLISAIDD